MSLDAQSIWTCLAEPVTSAVLRVGVGQVVHEVLEGQQLLADSDSLEYLQHYADANVQAAFEFACRYDLLQQRSPLVRVKTHCGWQLTPAQLAQVFCDPKYTALKSSYEAWADKHCVPLLDRFEQIWLKSGDEVLERSARAEGV